MKGGEEEEHYTRGRKYPGLMSKLNDPPPENQSWKEG